MNAVNEIYNLKLKLRLSPEEVARIKGEKIKPKIKIPNIEVPDGFKLCHTCLQIKPITAFHKQVGAKDGYRIHCIECVNKRTRGKYAESKRNRR